MDNYESEVQQILNEIDYTKYKPLHEVQEETNYAVELIYERFLRYKGNKENMEQAKDDLINYQYIRSIDDIKYGQYIKYISKKNFLNLQVSEPIKVSSKSKYFITGRLGLHLHRCKKSNTFFFKKIDEDDLIKMKLVELSSNK